MVSTSLSMSLTLAGEISSFSVAQRAALLAGLRASVGCQEPACYLTVRLRPGSIVVEATMTIPHRSSIINGVGSAYWDTVASVRTSATTLVTSPVATISTSLGNAVTSASPTVRTEAYVVAPIVVAPPPPAPPPARTPVVASPPLAPPTQSSESNLGQGTDTAPSDARSGFMMMLVVTLAVLFGTCLLVGLLFCALRLRQPKLSASARGALVNDGPRYSTTVPKPGPGADFDDVSNRDWRDSRVANGRANGRV